MGACHSQPQDEDKTDDQQNPVTTDRVDYQKQPLIDSNANYLDGGLANVADQVVISGSYPTEPGAAYVGDNAYQPVPAAFEVHHNNDAQDRDVYQQGSAQVITTNSDHQTSGLIQNGAGVSTNTIIASSTTVYDPEIGSMVYLLQKNEPVDGLERITPQETSIMPIDVNDRKEQQDQPMFEVEQTGLMDGAHIGNAQVENSNVEKIENYQNDLPNIAYEQVETQTAYQSVNQTTGMTVYDTLIGEMVTVLDENAPVDGMEEVQINSRKPTANYGNIPQNEDPQVVQQN